MGQSRRPNPQDNRAGEGMMCELCKRYDEAKEKLAVAVDAVVEVDQSEADNIAALLKVAQEMLKDASNRHIPEAC